MLIRFLLGRLRPYRPAVAAVAALQLAQSAAALFLPALNARIIDEGVVPGDVGAVLRAGSVMLAAVAAQLACASAATYVAARVAMAVGRDLRADVYAHTLAFSAREMNRFGAPSLLTRTTNDVQQVQQLLSMALTTLATTPAMFAGGVVMALGTQPRLSVLLPVAVPVLLCVLALLVRLLRAPYATMQRRLDQVNRVLREQIRGVRVVRAFVREARERERFAEANDRLTEVALRAGRLMGMMLPSGMLVANLTAVTAVWVGGRLVADGVAQPGALVAFLNYLALILGSTLLATFTVLLAPRAAVGVTRIREVLDTPGGLPLAATPAGPPPRGLLEVRDVGFRYPGAERPVLDGVSLVARPGEITAIVGATGSGKTTLLNLIARLADPTAGAVLVDGTDVRDLAPEALVRTVAPAPQTAYLFSGTIATNLRYGRPGATDAELWHALEIAQARDFVTALPDGLDTEVGQGGGELSGGQRQRLAIARLLVARPRIHLFDDSFSALDALTERALRDALAAETETATIVIVSHRAATVRDAHHIVVLDEGRVAGAGTHEELMRTNATYQEIVSSQIAVAA